MKKYLYFYCLTILLMACQYQNEKKSQIVDYTSFLSIDPLNISSYSFYSENVQDSFQIFISLPGNYHQSNDSFPVVYILDANVAFEMISTLMKLQSNGLGCRHALYVGVGYKDILQMDSLRGRDYTFPHEEEFPESGGGLKFSAFLRNELIPDINSRYRTENEGNTIIGHSLSGYFVVFNLLREALDRQLSFKKFIAGSPFVANDQYLLDLENELSGRTDSLPVQLFMCSGTIEDTDSMQLVFANILESRNYKGLNYESLILEDFNHMDILIPTWSRGLRFALSN